MTHLVRCLIPAMLLGTLVVACGQAQDDKKEQKEGKSVLRKGEVTGVVVAKGDNWIEVKADGEEKARKYVPHWRGGNPAQGGGLDKKMIAELKKIPVKSRVRMDWTFEERPRVEKIEVLK
ncbi:MAG: hypothetical protein ACOYNP_07080 [Gemmataceae bacterium]|jgi:hypothetical protein|nr:hypothetical protein [Planctomycetota bacterium]